MRTRLAQFTGPALSLFVLALLIALGEGLVRGAHAVTGEAWDADRIERRLLGTASAREVFVAVESERGQDVHDRDPKSRLVLSPYLGYDVIAAVESLEQDCRYFAGPECERNFDVLILGGSVAGLFTAEGGARRAAGLAGRPMRVIGHARGGYKQPQSLAVLTWDLLLGLRPDAVLLIDGFNEVALGNNNADEGFFPLQPSIHHWARVSANTSLEPESVEALFAVHGAQQAQRRHASLALRMGVQHSALFGSLALLVLRHDAASTAKAYADYSRELGGRAGDVALTGPGFEAGSGVEIAVQGWLESSRLMHAVCAARGIPFVHVLQPTLHDEGSKPLSQDELASASAPAAWIEGVHLGYDRLREGGRTLSDEGIAFLDASRIFADHAETLYFDACHFRAPGAELLADAIAPALRAAIDR